MRKALRCIDTYSSANEILPLTRSERKRMLKQYGDSAFLFPGGTPATDQPSFPIVNRDGCLSCSLLRASYIRLSQAKNRYPEKRAKIQSEIKKVVNMAYNLADRDDKQNKCNWSFRSKKRLIREV